MDLHGVLYGTLAAYQIMARQGYGHIVNTASAAGLLPLPFGAPYSTAKHAVVAAVRRAVDRNGLVVTCRSPVSRIYGLKRCPDHPAILPV